MNHEEHEGHEEMNPTVFLRALGALCGLLLSYGKKEK